MSGRQQYINKHLTKLLKKVEISIRQGEYEGAFTPADNLRYPILVYQIRFLGDDIGTNESKSGKRTNRKAK